MTEQQIPKGWRKVKIEDLGKIISGGTPSTTNSTYWDGDILWATPTEIVALPGKTITNTKRKITPEGLKNSSATLLPKGSLLVCTRATVGDLAIAGKEITTNQGFKSIVPSKDVSSDFIYYLLMSKKHELKRLACGSTFPEISKKDFSKISVFLPPLEVQRKIGGILSTWDEAIEAKEELLSNSQLQKKALMQKLLTGKERLPGFTGEWKEGKLCDVAFITMGQSPASQFYNEQGDGLPFLQGKTEFGTTYPSPNKWCTKSQKEALKDDILISVRAPVGAINIANQRYIIGRGLASIRAEQDPCYLFNWLKFKEPMWKTFQTGSTFESINSVTLKNFPIISPDLAEQRSISAVLLNADEGIENIQSDLANLKNEKKALMQRLLTSKKKRSVNEAGFWNE